MNKKLYIVHNFNARPYYQAVEYYAKENNIEIKYRETNWLKSIVKVIIGRKCINCNIKSILLNIRFCLKVPFMRNETIIYGTAPYDFRFIWYSLLKKENKVIYHTSHNKWGSDIDSVFLYGVFTSISKYFWKNFLKNENITIVTVTKEAQATLEKNFELSKKSNQIYHSIDLNKFKVKNKRNNKKIKILFVGRLVYEKGLDILAEVINQVDTDNFEFTIVGDGDYKDKISYIFERENVNYLGWISDKDRIASIFKEHDILLNPSIRYNDWEELFGIVNIEAMASGVVVIASDHIGPKEIIENEKNGFLVVEDDSKIIVELLNRLYANREYMSQISNDAIIRANDFSIIEIKNQWKEVILEN